MSTPALPAPGAGHAARVVVAVVTYNSAEVIAACLEAVPDGLAGVELAAVLVVDNASTDNTVEQVSRPDRTDAPTQVRVIPAGGNLGYAAAVNLARAAAPDHDYLLVLNPDTRLEAGAVRAMVEELAADARRGIAVPRLVDTDGRSAPNLRRAPSVVTAFGEAVLGGPRAARLGCGETVADGARYVRSGAVDWATGAALLVSRACWDAVGPWNPLFLLYSEETDFMLRAQDAGYLTWFVPDAVVTHRGGDLSTSPYLWSLMVANKIRLYRLRHGWTATLCYRLLVLFGEVIRAAAGRRRSRAAVRLLVRPSLVPTALPD